MGLPKAADGAGENPEFYPQDGAAKGLKPQEQCGFPVTPYDCSVNPG